MIKRSRERRAAVRMQAWGRMWIVKARMRHLKAVKLIQRTFRGSYARRHFVKSLRQNTEDKARRKRAQEEWDRLQKEEATAEGRPKTPADAAERELIKAEAAMAAAAAAAQDV